MPLKSKPLTTRVEDKSGPKDAAGRTPLHCAASRGHTDICKIILDQVDDVNPLDKDGNTPLSLAAEFDHKETCALLRSKINWFKWMQQQQQDSNGCSSKKR